MVHGGDRAAAIERLERALGETEIGGIQTTLPFHRFVAAHPAFRAAELSTGWVAEHWDGRREAGQAARLAVLAAAMADMQGRPGRAAVGGRGGRRKLTRAIRHAPGLGGCRARCGHGSLAGIVNGRDGLGDGIVNRLASGLPVDGSSLGGAGGRTRAVRARLAHTMGEAPAAIVVARAEEGTEGTCSSMGWRSRPPSTRLDPIRARLQTAAGSHDVLLAPRPDPRRAAHGIRRVEVVLDGWRFEVDVESEARARLRERATSADVDAAHGGPLELRAIIPGRVLSVDVAEGDAIEAGGRLLVIEAMKMQNELRAPRGGTVGRVAVGPGQTVELGDLLLVVE